MRMKPAPSSSHERGQVIVLLVLVFVALLGITGVAIDGGRLYSQRRSVQNAADNAALAGAFALCKSTNVVSAAVASAAQNGFTAAPPDVTVVVQNPPGSEYVTVTITSRLPLTLGRLVYSGTPEVKARAVARCKPGGGAVGWGNGLIALDPNNDNVVYGPSSGCLRVVDGGVFVESSNSSALFLDGGDGSSCPGGARIVAEWVQLVGGVSLPSWVIPYGNPSLWIKPWPPETGRTPRGDPMEDVATPPIPAQPGAPATPTIHGTCGGVLDANGNLSIGTGRAWCSTGVTIYPGRYRSIDISTDVPVTMQPGLYYVTNGNFTISGPSTNMPTGTGVSIYVASGNVTITSSAQANLTAGSSGVLFHVENGSFNVGGDSAASRTLNGMIYVNKGAITIDGGAALTTKAPTSGPYSGLAFFMGRANTNDLTVTGAGVLSMTGTIYAPKARIASTGSGSNKTVNGQMIAGRFLVTGGGRITINYDDDVVFGGGGSSSVELSE